MIYLSTNIKITSIHNNPDGKDDTSKLNEEYVVIKNIGNTTVDLQNWVISDWRNGQQYFHKYEFSHFLSNGLSWTFEPGEVIFLFTGYGKDVFVDKSVDYPPQFHLYFNNGWFIWNNTGDTAILYDAYGTIVSQLTVP